MSRIGIDLDGCLYDFGDAFRQYLISRYSMDERDLPEPESWSVWEHWGMSKSEWYEHFSEGVDAEWIFRKGDPEDHAIDVLKQLRKDGHSLHIVTHRMIGNRSVHNTYEWLSEHKVPYDTLTFAKDKTVVGTDYFIEDNADNYLALEGAGVKAVLIDRPWNRHIDAFRVINWKEFYDAIRIG